MRNEVQGWLKKGPIIAMAARPSETPVEVVEGEEPKSK